MLGPVPLPLSPIVQLLGGGEVTNSGVSTGYGLQIASTMPGMMPISANIAVAKAGARKLCVRCERFMSGCIGVSAFRDYVTRTACGFQPKVGHV